jgi:hypothetical protein
MDPEHVIISIIRIDIELWPTPLNIPEERRPQLHWGGSLKYRYQII